MNMNIAIIDADLIGRKRHRFPNLVCMKLSGYHKACGDTVTLKTDYEGLASFDKVYIAKVFTDTEIPDGGIFGNPLDLPNVEYGGTGFFYDNAPPLPPEIEHHAPDYHLYDSWLTDRDKGGTEFKAYKDYSIGFLTRGCFRHCPFCVNRRSNKVVKHSPLAEFLDNSRKKICLLDDNFFGYDGWRDSLRELIDTGKPFHFKQGLDVRLLDSEKAELLFNAKYDGDYIFAFDDWQDHELIEQKMRLIRRHTRRNVTFYTLCAMDLHGKYDNAFWKSDLINLFRRIELLMKYGCRPYVMRYQKYRQSPYAGLYTQITRWCNIPACFKKMSLREFCHRPCNVNSSPKHLLKYERENPDESFFLDMKMEAANG